MTFGESISTCFTKYANFDGRATRSEFWWFILFSMLVQMGASIVSQVIAGLLALALLLPTIAAGARRLHDIGRSGWWQLIGLIPLVNLLLLYWCVLPGAESANDYGAAPAAAEPAKT
jgi:uncharacterized membrane protein YhaH (DUF805 family)